MVIGKHLFKTEHLHYGYWTEDLEVDIQNMPKAQENYTNFIISHIPEGIKTVLDVGCGVGIFALKLINKGYQVDCVSPSPLLTKRAQELLGNRSHIFECKYENLQTEKRYDMVLFSESFQYVNLVKALENTLKFLNENGYLLICDFFKTDAKGKSVLGGGHGLTKFYNLISKYPFELVKDIDITKETAPNLKIVNDFLTEVGLPVWNLVTNYLNNKYPLLARILQWKYRKRIEKINRKYFSGARNAENFAIFKSYRLFLYKKAGTASLK
ncbi:MAG: class I SAM-dependent methyltransferase [Candidatus Aminicenantia bacterium]